MKTRGQLLTETFKRMDSLGITEAEDIIYQLAKELDELSQTEPALEEAPPIMEAVGSFELTKDFSVRLGKTPLFAFGSAAGFSLPRHLLRHAYYKMPRLPLS